MTADYRRNGRAVNRVFTLAGAHQPARVGPTQIAETAQTPAHIAIDETAPNTIIITGDIDMANAGRLDQALAATADAHSDVVIDFTHATYPDSAGITVLFTWATRMQLHLITR